MMELKIFGYFDDWINWFMNLPILIQIISSLIIICIIFWIILHIPMEYG
jgi:hypothetical protein